MKLRLKFGSLCKVADINDDAFDSYSLFDLKSTARSLFPDIPRQSSFSLSLNKKTPLEGDEVTLSDHGIVSGDLMYILLENQNQEPPVCPERPKPLTSGCTSVLQMFSTECLDQPLDCSQSREEPTDNKAPVCGVDSENGTVEATCETQSTAGDMEEGANCSSAIVEDFVMDSTEIDNALVNRYLSEPFLCRESTSNSVPSVLSDVYNSVTVATSHEALCVVLNVLLLESGYVPLLEGVKHDHAGHQESQKEPVIDSQELFIKDGTEVQGKVTMPDNWNTQPGRYTMQYTHTSSDDKTSFLLTCVPMGSTLILHGTVKGHQCEKLMMNLKTAEYVKDISNGATSCYQNLSKLSRVFKDGLAHRMLQQYKSATGEECSYGVFLLSHEVKLRIIGDLDVVSVLRLSQTCKAFWVLCKDKYIWRRLYLKDFGNRTENSLNHNWLRLYKQEYRLRKERQRIWKRNPMPVFMPPMMPSFGLPPPGPFHPGILGGDHDLYPFINHSEDRFFPNQLIGQRGNYGPASLIRPRFDPIGPLPGHSFRPGRGGGLRDGRGSFGGPKFF